MKVVYGDMSFAEMRHLICGKVALEVSTEFGDTAACRQVEAAVLNFCGNPDWNDYILVNNLDVLTNIVDGIIEEGKADLLKSNLYCFDPYEKSLSMMGTNLHQSSIDLFTALSKILSGK